MRVETAFNKILAIPGAWVASVSFSPDGVVVGLRRRRRRPRCPCGWKGRAVYDRSLRRWRHLDLGASRLFLEAEIRRIDCGRCQRVRTEDVEWARPGARHSRHFEDVVAWLAQRSDKTAVSKLMRTSWETVAAIVVRVVADYLDGARLAGLRRIGVDELSYRKGFRFLTVVADHDHGGRVVWAGDGHDHSVLERFYDELGPDGCAALEAVSLDLGAAYAKATDNKAPDARQCVDPFHVIQMANVAVDNARRWAWQRERKLNPRPKPGKGRWHETRQPRAPEPARWVKHTRWALLKDFDKLSAAQREILDQLRRADSVLYRCWQLKEGLRYLFRLEDPADAPAYLDWWLAWACRSRIPAFVTLSKTVRKNRDRILSAVELGLSNSRLEGVIIWSLFLGVVDVVNEGVNTGGGRVLWSASPGSAMSGVA